MVFVIIAVIIVVLLKLVNAARCHSCECGMVVSCTPKGQRVQTLVEDTLLPDLLFQLTNDHAVVASKLQATGFLFPDESHSNPLTQP